MKRKDFLKLTGLGIASMFFSPNLFAKPLDFIFNSDNENFDAIIVGTGYGSAVSALRLAQAGKKVLMLEMGMDWKNSGIPFSKMAWAENHSTWLRNTSIAPFGNYRIFDKFTGVLDRMDFDNVKVYAGRGIGGGSLANGGMSVTPKQSYFEEIFPDLDSQNFYSKYFPLANQELGVSLIPEEFYQNSDYYKFSRVGEKEAKNAGFETVRVPNVYDFDYMQQEENGTVTKSALDGEVIYGNNHGKKDLTKTYIKKALETNNVQIFALHKVEQIIDNNNGTYTIDISQINTKGETVGTKQLKTNKLFLGAGSLGTVELLLKSKAKGTLDNLNNQVGLDWGNNGNCMSGRNFIKGGTGEKQSAIPSAGIDNWNDTEHSFFTEIAPLPLGMETYAGLYLTINRVPNLGNITYNETEDKIDINWNSTNYQHMIDNSKYFIDKMNEHNGGTYAHLLFNNGIGHNICYHPLGGCVLGKATDLYGRVNGLPGIYVMDGALIPGTVGVNPYVTITAIAEYCIENIIENDFQNNDNSHNQEVLLTDNITASPVPFKNHIDIEYDNENANENVTISIINFAGTTLKTKQFTSVTGHNTNRLDGLWFLWGGNYILKITIGSRIYTKQVMK